ncbi:LexA family protein [Calditrichota bacterium LG25]
MKFIEPVVLMSNQNTTFVMKQNGSNAHQFYEIPVIGEVHLSEEDRRLLSKFTLGELLQNFQQENRDSVVVRALDNALAGAGIFKGDLLTVDLQSRPRSGDIAAVQFGSKLFIRKIFFNKNYIRLETAEEIPSPVIIDENTPGVSVLGRVTMVVREL